MAKNYKNGKGGRRYKASKGGNKLKGNKSESETKKKKTLSDYKYDIGSSKNASEYVDTTKYLISLIATTFDEADDIVTALTKLEEFDLDAQAPVVGSLF